MKGGVARRLRRNAAAHRAFPPPSQCGLQAERGKGKDRRSAAPASNHPLELTAHSAGFAGYSLRFLLWAAAQRERWADGVAER
jgi:hypothetical protein